MVQLVNCLAGCMHADYMVSSPANTLLQYCPLLVLYHTKIGHLPKMFLSDMPVWYSAQAATVQSELSEINWKKISDF